MLLPVVWIWNLDLEPGPLPADGLSGRHHGMVPAAALGDFV